MSTTPDPSVAAITVAGLECRYGPAVVLRDVSFTVRSGEIFFIIGGSGCGKSTLLRHLIGLHEPAAGTVSYFGEPFADVGEVRQRELLRTFGVLYQGGALWSSLTLNENVALPLEEYTPLTAAERDELVALKLAQVGLTGYGNHYPAELSGGMRKRAGLARALALDPAVVFFDEPSAGLDPLTSRSLDDLIRQIRDTLGTTCVVVSHELASVFALADRVLMLDKAAKGVVAEGNPHELAKPDADARARAFLTRGENQP
jgi:phospholipid/cholesterol/gamma-HCH transport system ATP-binding protein